MPKYASTPPLHPRADRRIASSGFALGGHARSVLQSRSLGRRRHSGAAAHHQEQFQQDVIALTKYDAVTWRSGAAIGTGANVERASDIVALLMMQSGARMTDARSPGHIRTNPLEAAAAPSPPKTRCASTDCQPHQGELHLGQKFRQQF